MYAPAPAIVRSRVSVSTATRTRCCWSAISSLESNSRFEGWTRANTAPAIASMTAVATTNSTNENPRWPGTSKHLRRFRSREARDGSVSQIGDEHLQDPGAVPTRWQRFDRPATKISAAGRHSGTAAHRATNSIDEVREAADVVV